MPKYLVKSPLSHDGKDYAIGKTIDLDEAVAATHIPDVLEPVPTSASKGKGDGETGGEAK